MFSVGLVPSTTAPEPVEVVAPVPPLATGNVPVTFVVRFTNVVDVEPVPPFAIGNAVPDRVIAKVPEVVIGLPAIDKKAGTDAATEVTVPPPPPEAVELIVWLGQVPEMVTLVPATSEGVVVPVPPLATGNVPETWVARPTPLRVPPRVKLPEVVTVPVNVMPFTVPVPATLVTVPEPPDASAAMAAVVVRTVAPLCTTGTISVPVRVPDAVRFDIEVLAMSYPWSR